MEQKDADNLVLRTESLVSQVIDCKTARRALRYISACMSIKEDFFIPAIVETWELWCMTYIPDQILQEELGYE